jgi:prepilin-type N-terminal cleavage/methylation domain-containing protein
MNKKTFTPKKKAFSLIELSIVLIIIGLLVAGVTGGASLIKNAELRAVMGEARGYQTAVNSFFARYNGIPGDYGQTGAAQGGDNNGVINLDNGVNRDEGYIALAVLGNEGFVDATYDRSTSAVDFADTSLTPGTEIPASKLQNAGWIFDSNNDTQNVVVLTKSIAAYNDALTDGSNAAVSLTASDALSIDTKSDDGSAASGVVRNHNGGSCDAAGVYDTAQTTEVCALSFEVGPDA